MPTPRRGRPTKPRELWLAKDPFLKSLQDACHIAAGTADLSTTERERQVEDAFFRAAVSLETFLSDWTARCLHFDTSRLASATRDEAAAHVARQLNGDWKAENRILARTVAAYQPTSQVNVNLPKTIAVQKARALLGVENSNQSFVDSAQFKEWVGRYLAAPQARAVSDLNAADDAVLDATIAIRNVIAHRSKQSEGRLRTVLAGASLPSPLRVEQTVTAAGIGRYLRVERQSRPRFKRYFERLASIANTLAPYQGRPRTICPDA